MLEIGPLALDLREPLLTTGNIRTELCELALRRLSLAGLERERLLELSDLADELLGVVRLRPDEGVEPCSLPEGIVELFLEPGDAHARFRLAGGGCDELRIGLGESGVEIGQPNIALSEASVALGKSCIGVGQPGVGLGEPGRGRLEFTPERNDRLLRLCEGTVTLGVSLGEPFERTCFPRLGLLEPHRDLVELGLQLAERAVELSDKPLTLGLDLCQTRARLQLACLGLGDVVGGVVQLLAQPCLRLLRARELGFEKLPALRVLGRARLRFGEQLELDDLCAPTLDFALELRVPPFRSSELRRDLLELRAQVWPHGELRNRRPLRLELCLEL